MYFLPSQSNKIYYKMMDRSSDDQLYNYEYHDESTFAVHRIIDPFL